VATLVNKATQASLIKNLEIASTFAQRGKGLLGRHHLAEDHALWIHHCNSIHTYFMKFAIDCVFVDRHLKVRAVYEDVRPWRLIFPVWGASSVIEMSSGVAKKLNIKKGDVLDVGA
jgi:uncharacterized membrane protein (UPF0127 family)